MADSWPAPKPATKAAIAVLSTALSPTLVARTAPHTIPDPFVRVSRVGGSQPDPATDMARILVECWAGSIGEVETLASNALAALRNAQGQWFGGAFIRAFDNVDGPVDFPDPDVSELLRFQFHGDLNVATHNPTEGS